MAAGKRLVRGAIVMLGAKALRSRRRPGTTSPGTRAGGGSGAAGVVSRLVSKQLRGRRGRY
ncbi:hypothetical protein [Streptomyces specialis]|uniref:hypothetical protein n=1 Tax=Streptomyces specialis TaxID=498367 RepID=UPI000A4F7536|nr:hypothetical protein [Streptomyces specialis]